jgi:hypothetical protein
MKTKAHAAIKFVERIDVSKRQRLAERAVHRFAQLVCCVLRRPPYDVVGDVCNNLEETERGMWGDKPRSYEKAAGETAAGGRNMNETNLHPHKAEVKADETPAVGQDGYFGLCPACRRTDGYINVERAHWFFCKAHKNKWYIGSNLFSAWRDETEEEQRRRFDELDFESFEVVEPLYPPSDAAKMLTGHCDGCGLIVKFEDPGLLFELLCTACDATPSRWTGQAADVASAAEYFVRSGLFAAGRGAVLRLRNGGLVLGTCRCGDDNDAAERRRLHLSARRPDPLWPSASEAPPAATSMDKAAGAAPRRRIRPIVAGLRFYEPSCIACGRRIGSQGVGALLEGTDGGLLCDICLSHFREGGPVKAWLEVSARRFRARAGCLDSLRENPLAVAPDAEWDAAHQLARDLARDREAVANAGLNDDDDPF